MHSIASHLVSYFRLSIRGIGAIVDAREEKPESMCLSVGVSLSLFVFGGVGMYVFVGLCQGLVVYLRPVF